MFPSDLALSLDADGRPIHDHVQGSLEDGVALEADAHDGVGTHVLGLRSPIIFLVLLNLVQLHYPNNFVLMYLCILLIDKVYPHLFHSHLYELVPDGGSQLGEVLGLSTSDGLEGRADVRQHVASLHL